MLQHAVHFIRRFSRIYMTRRISRASAALSYFLTLTFFPLIICIYSLLGNSYDKAMLVLDFAKNLMAAETAGFLEDFLNYIAANESVAMTVAGVTVLISSSSAAARSLQATIGEIQGGQRYQGLRGFVFSIVFSLLFISAIYFAVLVVLTGRSFIDMLNAYLPFLDIRSSWDYVRFIVLFGIEYTIIWGVYEALKRNGDEYNTHIGALLATGAMVGVSIAFSVFIGASAKYPLVYGSLASVILLMLWLYTCCLVIYCGAVVNVVLRDMRRCR